MPVGVLGLVSQSVADVGLFLHLPSSPSVLLRPTPYVARVFRVAYGRGCKGDQECGVMPGLEGVLVCAPAVGPVCTRVCTCGCAR